MPSAARRPWLICYDISDPRRLGRVHRYLKRYAMPVQYSVFLARVNTGGLNRIMGGIAARIDPRADDVRAYPLIAGGSDFSYGRVLLPDDVLVLGTDTQLIERTVLDRSTGQV